MSYARANIHAMSGYVPGEQPRHNRVIKLNTNENPYRCSPKVDEAIRAVLGEGLRKYPHPMCQPFREKAGDVLGVDPEWILCGNGSDDILTICTRTFVGEGELLRLPYPSYILYKTLAEIQNARSEEVAFNEDWSLSPGFAAATEGLRFVFLPNPNSPSGTLVSREEILALAKRLPCPLLVDEAYADFAEFNCLDLVAENERIMVSRTLSKSYALAGLRFGFIVAQPQMIEEMAKVKDSYNCDALSIAAATAAVSDRAWLGENRAKILKTRGHLAARMQELGFNTVDSQANFVWCTHPTQPVKPIFEALKQDGIFVRYMHYEGWGDGLRISVGTDEEIDRCLERIEACL